MPRAEGMNVGDEHRVSSVTYIVNVRLPTEKAHGLQLARMCEAFQRLHIRTALVHPARRQPQWLIGMNPLDFYSVRCQFAVHTLPNLDIVRTERWLPGGLFTVAHFAHSLLWAEYAVRHAPLLAPADFFVARDIPVAAALVRRGLPTVLELHRAPERWSLRLLKRVAENPFLRVIVTMTEALRQTLASRGIAITKTTALHDGVDLERYEGPPETPWRVDQPIVLYTGHLFREKGIETLVEAARRLAPDVEVKVAGGMPQHVDEWRRRVAEHGPDNVEFMGYLPPERIPPLQKGADLLLLPNSGQHPHSARYTSPMKLFEYMAAGTPIVASDVPAIQEVLEHDANALFVPPDDAAALADAIRALLTDRARGERLARQAAIDVRQYSWDRRAGALARAAGYEMHAPPGTDGPC